jgi:TonB family protein
MKKEVGHILRNNPEFKRRALCFAGSVLVHTLLLLAIIVFFQPIELPQEERVTEVIITPQEDLLIPHLERLLSGRSVRTSPESEENIRSSTRPPGAEAKDATGSQSQIQMGSTDNAPSPLPEFSQGFRLTSFPEDSSGFNLNIAPSKDLSPEPEDYLTENEMDLLRYLSSASSTKRPLGTSPSTETFGARISTPGKTSFNINKLDISPWAREVVEKIQKNWAIPTSQDDGKKNVVEIKVSIGKNGELLNVSIRNSSAHPTLDQAALNAIRISAPFPELPENFPNNNLDVHFLFQYNE